MRKRTEKNGKGAEQTLQGGVQLHARLCLVNARILANDAGRKLHVVLIGCEREREREKGKGRCGREIHALAWTRKTKYL